MQYKLPKHLEKYFLLNESDFIKDTKNLNRTPKKNKFFDKLCLETIL